MKIFLICLLILLTLILPSKAQDTPNPVSIGKLLINIEYVDTISGLEYNTENLDQSLRNHLDFFLWRRGLDFEFAQGNVAVQIDSLLKSGTVSDEQYFLNIRVSASLKSEKVRPASDAGNKKVTYGGFLKIGLALTMQNLKTGQIWPEYRNVVCESRKEWVREGDRFMSYKQTLFEPPDYVIMRALSLAFDFLPVSEPTNRYTKYDIPVYMILDDKSAGEWDDTSAGNDRLALAYASRSLQRQFGFGLRPVGIDRLNSDPTPFK
ncbi:MAG: hypothetical protein AB1746_13700, partial [Candidatus Zixiibacteriota bacterium]